MLRQPSPVMFVVNTLVSPSVLRVLILTLLLSNLRATWIASFWEPESQEAALRARFDETWGDKFVDKLPMWLWPRVPILYYYVFSISFLILVTIGLAVIMRHHRA
jgi:hypothetical protein